MTADAREQHDTDDEKEDQGEDGGDFPAPATGSGWHGVYLNRFPFGSSRWLSADAKPIPPATTGEATGNCLYFHATFVTLF